MINTGTYNFLLTIYYIIVAFFINVSSFIFASCNEPDGCNVGDVRCYETELEVCNKKHNWEYAWDCSAMENADGPGDKWTCCDGMCKRKDECKK